MAPLVGTFVALCSIATPVSVRGHGYLMEPPARNFVNFPAENCPHCGQANGVTTVKAKANGIWPTKDQYGSHGLCGDAFQGRSETTLANERYMLYTNEPQRTYTAGSIVSFVVGMSTHHKGHFEFRICDHQLNSTLASYADGQACLDTWVLERVDPAVAYGDCVVDDTRGDCQPVDPNHIGRWYLPPTSYAVTSVGSEWTDVAQTGVQTYLDDNGGALPGGADMYHMLYKIPDTLVCDKCTLQFYWSTANNCLYDADYFTYFQDMEDAGWDAASWSDFAVADWATIENRGCGNSGLWGEEFWNCADIRVVPGGPTTAPTPTPSPTVGPTSTPTPAPTPSPTFLQPTPPPTTPAPTPTPPPTVTPSTACYVYNCGGCPPDLNAAGCNVHETPWCSESTSNCASCNGHFCGPDTPTPSPTPASSSNVCYEHVCDGCPPDLSKAGCAVHGSTWCSESSANCNGCNGHYCAP